MPPLLLGARAVRIFGRRRPELTEKVLMAHLRHIGQDEWDPGCYWCNEEAKEGRQKGERPEV